MNSTKTSGCADVIVPPRHFLIYDFGQCTSLIFDLPNIGSDKKLQCSSETKHLQHYCHIILPIYKVKWHIAAYFDDKKKWIKIQFKLSTLYCMCVCAQNGAKCGRQRKTKLEQFRLNCYFYAADFFFLFAQIVDKKKTIEKL